MNDHYLSITYTSIYIVSLFSKFMKTNKRGIWYS